eukprot:scaffold4822_cov60-Phaeocystis_antarctica.AAC.7
MPPASKRFRSGGHTPVRTHSQPPTQHSPPPASHSQSASAQSMAAPIETQSRGSCRWMPTATTKLEEAPMVESKIH